MDDRIYGRVIIIGKHDWIITAMREPYGFCIDIQIEVITLVWRKSPFPCKSTNPTVGRRNGWFFSQTNITTTLSLIGDRWRFVSPSLMIHASAKINLWQLSVPRVANRKRSLLVEDSRYFSLLSRGVLAGERVESCESLISWISSKHTVERTNPFGETQKGQKLGP